jgi:glucose/arabinose dehydrogenase
LKGLTMLNRAVASLTAGLSTAMCLLASGQNLPDGFVLEEVAAGLEQPVAIAFAGDGRMFVVEKRGVVRVFTDGIEEPQPFIDLSDEVDPTILRGMLGFALAPDFLENRRVYMAYPVVPAGGIEPFVLKPTFCRVVRYTGTAASDGSIADLDSRFVLIGEKPHEGIPACYAHLIGAIRFGEDGSLLVSAGDAAHYEFADGGGNNPDCFKPQLFDSDQDIGAFRSQYLGSMSGKVLRIDPETGHGLPDNPYWNGDPTSPQSRVWAYGLRTPHRFCVRPGSGSASFPGSIYIGDVGWNRYEEVSISVSGGENFGWPCYEGWPVAPEYQEMTPPHSGCDTIGTPANPGPLTAPRMWWHPSNPNLSQPDPVVGRCVISGDFYTGDSYPVAYRGAYFYADYVEGWVRAMRVNDNDERINSFGFATSINQLVEILADPVSGDLHIVEFTPGAVYRVRYEGPGPGDLNGDGVVDVIDLLMLLDAWGECLGGPQECVEDINGDGVVDVLDLLILLDHWG